MAKDLINAGADLTKSDRRKENALSFAARYDNSEFIAFLLEKTENLKPEQRQLNRCLGISIAMGYEKTSTLFLEAGANPNTLCDYDLTPLMSAVEREFTAMIKPLLKAGAKINLANKEGQTALHLAVKKGSVKMVELLLKNKAKVNVRDKNGGTPLMQAALSGNTVLVERLLAAGADVNAQNKYGQTALMLATQKKAKETMRVLLDRGADVTLVNKKGMTAYDFAIEGNQYDVVKLLEDHARILAARQELYAEETELTMDKGVKILDVFNFRARVHTRSYFSPLTQNWTPPVITAFDDIPDAARVLRPIWEKYQKAGGTIGEEAIYPEGRQKVALRVLAEHHKKSN
jgi:ankyrin repeat protein